MSEIAPEGAEPTAEPAEAAEPAWAGPSQEDWQQLTQLVGYVVQHPLLQQQQQAEEAEIDPFSDNYAQQVRGLIQQETAELRAFKDQMALEAAEETAMEILEGFAKDDPFLYEGSAETARRLVPAFLTETQQRYGNSMQAAREAIRMAHQATRELEKNAGARYHEQEMQQLQGLGQVRREPQSAGVNGAAQQHISASGPGDERAIVAKYFPQ